MTKTVNLSIREQLLLAAGLKRKTKLQLVRELIDLREKLATIETDRDRLRDALNNLVVAVKQNDNSAQDEYQVRLYCDAANSALERSNHIVDGNKMVGGSEL